MQEEYLKQSNEVSKFLKQFDSTLTTKLENIIDSVAKEVALENGLNAIAEKEHILFYKNDLLDYTTQIIERSAVIVEKIDLEKILNATTFIEKLENDWKVVMSKKLEDFPGTMED